MTFHHKNLGIIASTILLVSLTLALPAPPRPAAGQATAPATPPTLLPTDIPIPQDAHKVTEEQVTRALTRGVDYLLAAKNKAGHWEPAVFEAEKVDKANYRHGVSALALYALLHVGESLDDKRLKPRSEELAEAIKYVAAMEPEGIYGAALQANVLALLPKRPDLLVTLERRKDQLARSMRADGGHSYFLNRQKMRPGLVELSDASNSQYAMLGLWAIQDISGSVPHAYWLAADKYWRSIARADGGFPYYATDNESRFTMTAAGAASLLITAEYADRQVRLEAKADKILDAAMEYLARNYKPDQLGGYALYGMERVGLASGRKFFGNVNWFAEGAASLLLRQGRDGSWELKEIDGYENKTVSTAFALLFLARGRNAVIFNKLEYGAVEGSAWNARPRDAMHLSEWMGRQFERPINWQTVGVDVPVEEWFDAPVLLITGAKDPRFTPDQVNRLRRYAREGGLIFSSADGNSKEFTAAMRQYADEITAGTGTWRELPKTHDVYSVYQKMDGEVPPLIGLTNGVRELWIHSPNDLGAAWQAKLRATPAERTAGRTEKDRPWEIAANVFFYANGKGSMRSKLQSLAVSETGGRAARTIKIGRLAYAGTWDPEPGAFDRLSRIARAKWQTDLQFQKVDFDRLADVPIVYMTGVEKPDLRADQRWALRTYLNNGGILIADAANSSRDFDAWFQKFVRDTFADDRWELLDDRSVVFAEKTAPGMTAIKETALRPLTQVAVGFQTKPRIYSLISREKPRVRILYSPLDLTLGYLGTTTHSFSGYTPESAELLARNLILYAHAVAGAKK